MKPASLARGPRASTQVVSDPPAIAGGRPVRAPENRLVFGAPVIGDAEIASVAECLRSKWIGLGPRVEQLEREFARYKGAAHALAVNSGTAAVHLALVGLGIGPGDEVIAPAMTFCSPIHAIVHSGAAPVLVDCRRDTFNVDPAEVERQITSRTRAILVVHMCGRCCEMDPILEIARRHGLRVIEDCAHAIEAAYRGTSAGLMGNIGCFSFYATKNVTTADGGMIVTTDPELFQRMRVLSLHGMTADAWSRFTDAASGYQVVAAGFKYNMTDLSASLGLPQLAAVEERWHKRRQLWALYDEQLKDLPLLLPPPVEADSRHACHLYTPLLDMERTKVTRDQVIAALEAENIGAGVHYVPVHQQPYYRERFGFTDTDFPNALFVGERTFSLPLSPTMSEEDVIDVKTALARIFRHYAA